MEASGTAERRVRDEVRTKQMVGVSQNGKNWVMLVRKKKLM